MNNEKLVFRGVMAISIFVFVAVIVLNRKLITPPAEIPDFVFFLPKLNAFINGTCSILLIISYFQIRRKNIEIHKKLNLTTFALSSVFLLSYIIYHFYAGDTHFGGFGLVKVIYYFILITHIVLAALVLPLILLSFYYGLNMKVEKHRKLVRFAFPIWLYVTITGVIVYLMISPYYSF